MLSSQPSSFKREQRPRARSALRSAAKTWRSLCFESPWSFLNVEGSERKADGELAMRRRQASRDGSGGDCGVRDAVQKGLRSLGERSHAAPRRPRLHARARPVGAQCKLPRESRATRLNVLSLETMARAASTDSKGMAASPPPPRPPARNTTSSSALLSAAQHSRRSAAQHSRREARSALRALESSATSSAAPTLACASASGRRTMYTSARLAPRDLEAVERHHRPIVRQRRRVAVLQRHQPPRIHARAARLW